MKRETKASLWLTITVGIVIALLCLLMGCNSNSGKLKPMNQQGWIGFHTVQHPDGRIEHYYSKGDSARVIELKPLPDSNLKVVTRDYRYKVEKEPK